jgi:hypothetical protein
MELEDLVRDLARRTKLNLEAIVRAERNGDEVFSTTQLINSLLSLLVFPRERLQIPVISIRELQDAGWLLPKPLNSYKQRSDLRQLIGYLRHAVCHGHIDFVSQDHEIVGVIFWNEPHGGLVDWKVSIAVEDLKDFVARFAKVIEQAQSALT